MMLFSLAPERLYFLSTLCRFLTGQKQAITPTITHRALPDCGERSGASPEQSGEAKSVGF
jgi:hypothetical protein